MFKYCQCGLVFCESCYNLHKLQHSKSIDSDKFFLQCKNQSHFGEKYSGYCYECDKNFCEKCQNDHINHSKVKNSYMEIDKDQNTNKINKFIVNIRSIS